MSQENVEIVRLGVAALNRGDVEAFTALCDSQFKMRLVGVVGEGVDYAGADGVREFFRDMSDSWTGWRFDIEDARDVGDRVVAIGVQRGQGRASGVEVEARRACVIGVRDGVVTDLQYFLEPAEALEAVGLER